VWEPLDKVACRQRNQVERFFARIKQFRPQGGFKLAVRAAAQPAGPPPGPAWIAACAKID
jgi:hypothetical protein